LSIFLYFQFSRLNILRILSSAIQNSVLFYKSWDDIIGWFITIFFNGNPLFKSQQRKELSRLQLINVPIFNGFRQINVILEINKINFTLSNHVQHNFKHYSCFIDYIIWVPLTVFQSIKYLYLLNINMI